MAIWAAAVYCEALLESQAFLNWDRLIMAVHFGHQG